MSDCKNLNFDVLIRCEDEIGTKIILLSKWGWVRVEKGVFGVVKPKFGVQGIRV